MSIANAEIRKAAKAKGIPFWRIANYLGVSEATFTIWMRSELPKDKKERITAAIEELSAISTANVEIRRAARANNVPLWKIAAYLGVSEPTLSRWLRFELSKERKEHITSAIEKIARESE